MMDSRILDPPHAQFGGSLGGMVGFPYHLSHHHVYELTGHQLQSASAVPFSIDGLLNGSCAASVGNSNPLLSSGCGMNGDNQHYKLTGKPCLHSALLNNISGRNKDKGAQVEDKPDAQAEAFSFASHFNSISSQIWSCTGEETLFLSASKHKETAPSPHTNAADSIEARGVENTANAAVRSSECARVRVDLCEISVDFSSFFFCFFFPLKK